MGRGERIDEWGRGDVSRASRITDRSQLTAHSSYEQPIHHLSSPKQARSASRQGPIPLRSHIGFAWRIRSCIAVCVTSTEVSPRVIFERCIKWRSSRLSSSPSLFSGCGRPSSSSRIKCWYGCATHHQRCVSEPSTKFMLCYHKRIKSSH